MPGSRLDHRRQTDPAGRTYFGTAETRASAPLARFATDPGLESVLQALADGFGRRYWWPAASAFEVIVGAVLTQNTAWGNVELALANLRAARALEPRALLALPWGTSEAEVAPGSLEALIGPSGAFRQKARKLRAVTAWMQSHSPNFDLGFLGAAPLEPLRDELLGVFGIGPETADSILCYAAGRRTAVVDTYTRRVLARHGLVPDAAKAKYEVLRNWLQARLIDDPLVYEEFHALFVVAGYDHCKPTASCETCPGAPVLESLPL